MHSAYSLYSFVLETAQTGKRYQMYGEHVHNYFLITCNIQTNYTSAMLLTSTAKPTTFSMHRIGGGRTQEIRKSPFRFLILNQFGKKKEKKENKKEEE